MMRREVLAVWILLSAPIVGFVAYLQIALGLQMAQDQFPLLTAMVIAIVSLFFLSWAFLSHSGNWDWRTCARFMSVAFLFEGVALALTRNSGGHGSLYFGIGTILAGLVLFFGAKKH